MRTFDQKPALWAEIIVPRATILSPRDIIFARGRFFWPTGGNFVPRAKDDKHYWAFGGRALRARIVVYNVYQTGPDPLFELSFFSDLCCLIMILM